MAAALALALLAAVMVLPSVHAYPLKYFGFWQNNSTQTASFTNFAFEQDTPEALVADYELGVTGLWFLEYGVYVYTALSLCAQVGALHWLPRPPVSR